MVVSGDYDWRTADNRCPDFEVSRSMAGFTYGRLACDGYHVPRRVAIVTEPHLTFNASSRSPSGLGS